MKRRAKAIRPLVFRRGTENRLRWPYSESWLCNANDNATPWGKGWEVRPSRRAGR